MVSQCLKVLMNMMNHHKSIFKSKDCLYKEFPANKIPDLVEQMQVSSKSQQSQRLDHQLPPTHQQSHFWLFLHGSPSNFLYEVSKQHHSCRTRRWRQTPRNRQHQARWKEKRKVKRWGQFASEEQFPSQQNLHAHKQIVGLKLCRQASWPTPPIKQQVKVMPLLVPPEILFQRLPQQQEPRQSWRSPGNNFTENFGVDQSVSQLTVGVEV